MGGLPVRAFSAAAPFAAAAVRIICRFKEGGAGKGEVSVAMLGAETLMACETLCSFGSSILYGGPDRARLAALVEQRALLREPLFRLVAGDAAERLLSCLDDAAQDQEAFAAFYRELRQDYAYLFYMASASGVSVYESVYRTDDGTLFGPTTLEVRAAYAAFGYALESSASEPDDHLGIELAFLAKLFALASEDDRKAERALAAAADFMGAHVLAFSGDALRRMHESARSVFYREAALLIAASIDEVASTIGARAA